LTKWEIVETEWQKSSFCAGGGNNCLEARREGSVIHLRESQVPESEITLTPAQFAVFLSGVKAGEFDDLV
jgi:hypothetical protein